MNDRQKNIVDELHIKPNDRVLEIGCGQGVAGTYVCEKLTAGFYLGVDRSEKMITAATRRNQRFIDEGKAQFLLQELENLDLGEQKFDKILAVRVRLFYSEPERARKLVEKYLAPNGMLKVVYDTPS
jgi:cyclopropane fatty-acyl-phospholipid synthase-like methyltransferase